MVLEFATKLFATIVIRKYIETIIRNKSLFRNQFNLEPNFPLREISALRLQIRKIFACGASKIPEKIPKTPKISPAALQKSTNCLYRGTK